MRLLWSFSQLALGMGVMASVLPVEGPISLELSVLRDLAT